MITTQKLLNGKFSVELHQFGTSGEPLLFLHGAGGLTGVDPFLEDQDYWKEFHTVFLAGTQEALADRVPDGYEVRIEERLSLMYEPDPNFHRTVWPDVAVVRAITLSSTSPQRTSVSRGAWLPMPWTNRMPRRNSFMAHE